jgi:hypothetical protein
LYNARVYRSDDINGAIQVRFTDPGFPCIRKATLYSRLAVTHHRNS